MTTPSTSIYTRKNRAGENLTIGLSAELEIATNGKPEQKYATICDDHQTHVLSRNRLLAYNTRGIDFCDDCRARAGAPEETPAPKNSAPAKKAAPTKKAAVR